MVDFFFWDVKQKQLMVGVCCFLMSGVKQQPCSQPVPALAFLWVHWTDSCQSTMLLKRTRGIKLQDRSCVSSGVVTAQVGLLMYRHTPCAIIFAQSFLLLRRGSRHSKIKMPASRGDSLGRDSEGQDGFERPMSHSLICGRAQVIFLMKGAPGSHTRWSDKTSFKLQPGLVEKGRRSM